MSNGKKANKEGRTMLQTPELLAKREVNILNTWMKNQLASVTLRPDLINKKDLEKQSREFLAAFVKAISTGNMENIEAPEYKPIVEMLEDISRTRTAQGFTSSEIVTFLISLQDAIFQYLQAEYVEQPEVINREMVLVSKLLVKLVLVVVEAFAKTREELITKHQESILKMSTPMMILWKDILLLPLVGTLDSRRAQLVMEMGLKKIAETESKVIILDILGVPAVDTAVANHILKITKATKLMGCNCILSGMSPEVAQSIVQLGVDLGDLITKATLKDALEHAFHLRGIEIGKQKKEEIRDRR